MNMIDCFITTQGNRSPEREYFFYLTQLALHLQGFSSKTVEKPMLERYFECDRQAESDIYIMCDDDIIPATSNTLTSLVNTLREHPEISQLGLGWRPDMKNESNNSWIRGHITKDIWEIDHVGGCVAIRKGTIKDLGYRTDYKNGIGDDKIAGKIARELGYKVAVSNKLYFHHLGSNFTTVWK